VRFGRLVLALATWRVSASEVATLTGDEHDLFDAVSRLRSRLGWPRFIAVDRHDGPLSVDLDEPWSVEAFAHSLRRSGGGVVRELWPEPGRLCLRGPEGGYRHELVVPFARRVVARSPTRRVAPTRQHGVDTHPPGSHWLSAKVYVGPGLADSVLTRTVEPLVAKARADGWVDRWFFLRYADPQPHLRVRLRRTEPTYGELLDHVCEHLQPLLDDGTVHRWELDTYQPELHRYGGAAALDLAEQIFEADSNAVVSLLAELPSGRRGADERWRLALLGVAAMLADSGRDAAERLHWLSARGARMREELGLVGVARRQLGGRFRMLRGDLERLLERLDDAQDSLPWIAFRERSQVCRPLFAGLLALDARDELSAALDDVLWSLTHLHVNRVMSTAARQHECLIYDFLSRLLRARLARAAG
jgi:thiopeptide-type bacteriocin biosynthesis protein